jgi:hypothetical protein
MANSPGTELAAAGLVGGAYRIDFSQVLAGAADPLKAFAAHDERDGKLGLMAVAVQRGLPARARAMSFLAGVATPNLLSPLAHGAAAMPNGESGYFVICQAPPGPSVLSTLRVWSEVELTDHLLKPVAAILATLQARHVTHRALRAGNVFQGAARLPVSLGCAWAAPAAADQPAWMEPAYSAMCLPCGRGEGTIADDVYALGALLVMLALGADPLAGADAESVIRRKLDLGSYAAIVGTHRLPVAIAELARGMLADDPEHRPSPALLKDPPSARARRVAARPLRRAQRPLEVGPEAASNARMLAYALQQQPAQGVLLLRSGAVDRWLRRGVGDTAVAGKVDEVVRLRETEGTGGDQRADALLVMRTVAVLDPLAPLIWHSLAFWPDGLGPALDHALHHAPADAETLVAVVVADVTRAWSERRPAGPAPATDMRDAQTWLKAGRGAGLRLSYTLNALTPCDSPLLTGRWIIRVPDLLAALEQAAARQPRGGQPMMDAPIIAFIAARRDERMDADVGRLAGAVVLTDLPSQARLLACLQGKLIDHDFPHLSRWAAEAIRPMLAGFSSRSRRDRLLERLKLLGEAGQMPPIVALLDNEPELASDQEGLAIARARIASIDQALGALEAAAAVRSTVANRIALDVAGGLGLLACVVALAFAVFS